MEHRALQWPTHSQESICLRRQHLSRVPQRKRKMLKVKEKFSNFQPTKGLVNWQRKRTAKVVPEDVPESMQKDDVPRQTSPSHTAFSSSSSQPLHNRQWQAAAQEENDHISSRALGEQVRPAGPEGQAAAPHSPRGRGRAVLGTLQSVARATLRRIAGVIRPRGQQPGEQRHVEHRTGVATAGTTTAAAAAGAEIQAAASHSPGCPPSPFSSHMEALSGQGAGATVEEFWPEKKEGTWSEGESLWDTSSLLEETPEQSLRAGEESSSVSLPCELWAEPRDSQVHNQCPSARTYTVSVPALSSTSLYTRANTPTADSFLYLHDLSPSPNQLQNRNEQGAGAAVAPLPPVAKEGTWSNRDSFWDNSSLRELGRGQENTRQLLPPVEDIKGQELFQEEKRTKIHTIWVKAFYPPLLPHTHAGCQERPSSPSRVGREAAQEADADPHSPCPAPAGPTDSQAATEEILPAPASEEGALGKLERDLSVLSLQDLSQGQQNAHQRCRGAQEGLPPPRPREAWAEQRGPQQPTAAGRAPLCRISSPYVRPKAPSPLRCARTPSSSQLQELSEEWVGTPFRGMEGGSELLDSSSDWEGEEDSDPSLSHEDTTLSQENWEDIKIYSIWVKPSLRAALMEPQTGRQDGSKCPCSICREAAEEVDADLHSPCPALREPMNNQAAAAGLATAPEEEQQRTALTAKAQGVAKTAASPALGERVRPAGPEGQAAAPHSLRGRGRAVLDTLQRWARATLRKIAGVIWPQQ